MGICVGMSPPLATVSGRLLETAYGSALQTADPKEGRSTLMRYFQARSCLRAGYSTHTSQPW